MHIEPIPRWVVLGSATAVIILANLRGDLTARVVAAALTVQVVVDFAHIYEPLSGLPTVGATFAVYLVCVLWSRRYWTIWAAAGALLSVATDLLRIYMGLGDWSYYSAQVVWFYVQMGALLVGVLVRPPSPAASALSARKPEAP